jgi:hypothetical protein
LNLFSNVHPNGFLENILLVVRQFRMFCSGRRSLRGYSFASTQILELALMSSALIAAVCISASLASKFENATTIISPHIVRVETIRSLTS